MLNKLGMPGKEMRFARYSRTFCCLLAAIWLLLGLFLLTSERSSEMLSGALWMVGALFFFVTGFYLPKSSARATREPKSEDKPDAT